MPIWISGSCALHNLLACGVIAAKISFGPIVRGTKSPATLRKEA